MLVKTACSPLYAFAAISQRGNLKTGLFVCHKGFSIIVHFKLSHSNPDKQAVRSSVYISAFAMTKNWLGWDSNPVTPVERSAWRVASREINLGYTDSSLISRRSPIIVTLRGGIQEYFSEKHTQDQRGSNPGRMHYWRGSRALYQCATSPSLYIQPIAELNNELSRRVAILEGLRW